LWIAGTAAPSPPRRCASPIFLIDQLWIAGTIGHSFPLRALMVIFLIDQLWIAGTTRFLDFIGHDSYLIFLIDQLWIAGTLLLAIIASGLL